MCLAIPGQVVSITEEADPLLKRGQVSFSGVVREVSLAYVPEVTAGQYVVVHAGFALSIVDEDLAQQTLADLAEMKTLVSSTDIRE